MRFLFLLALAIIASGCSNLKIDTYNPYITRDDSFAPKNVVLFFDGTANDLESQTNVSTFYNLIRNQPRDDFATLYLDGVGTKQKFLGFVAGLGVGLDVRDAYSYLGKHYRKDDSLYFVGYSRGAFAARVLAGLISTVGVIDTRTLTPSERDTFTKELYEAFKNPTPRFSRPKHNPKENSATQRATAVRKVLDRWREKTGLPLKPIEIDTRITAMALWDTIEALGAPNYKEDIGYVNDNYIDQICNANKIFHAVALDDNRSRIYTPILMTYRGINNQCSSKVVDDIVEEVWFSGAHADIGGGYGEGYLSGVSLNWMIRNMQATSKKHGINSLFNETPTIFENVYDVIHDAEGGNFLYSLAFKREERKPKDYILGSSYNDQKLKVHCSVTKRLESQKTKVQEQLAGWRLSH